MTRISYTQGPGQWGQLISQHNSDTGQTRYYGFDPMGNTRFLTDSSGIVTDRYSYKAFGEETVVTGSTANPMRYGGEVGYYRDKIERVYVRARHYEPPTGMWLSRDPIGHDAGDWNLYRYVGNDPIRFVDGSGLAKVYVRYKLLWYATGPVGTGYSNGYHSYILITDNDGTNPIYIRGGLRLPGDPRFQGASRMCCQRPEGGFNSAPGYVETVVTYYGDYKKGSPDWESHWRGTRRPSLLIKQDSLTSRDYLRILRPLADRITKSCTPYQYSGHGARNSNASVRYILEAGGLPAPPPPRGVVAPGWEGKFPFE